MSWCKRHPDQVLQKVAWSGDILCALRCSASCPATWAAPHKTPSARGICGKHADESQLPSCCAEASGARRQRTVRPEKQLPACYRARGETASPTMSRVSSETLSPKVGQTRRPAHSEIHTAPPGVGPGRSRGHQQAAPAAGLHASTPSH